MSLWYAHMGTFVFLFNSPLAEPKHEMRGWCTFERAMSRLCKDNSHAGEEYLLQLGFPAVLPHKVRELGDDHPLVGPPLAPSAFADLLRERAFTNSADSSVVSSLYASAITEVYALMPFAHFDRYCWRDADAADAVPSAKDGRDGPPRPSVRLSTRGVLMVVSGSSKTSAPSISQRMCPVPASVLRHSTRKRWKDSHQSAGSCATAERLSVCSPTPSMYPGSVAP